MADRDYSKVIYPNKEKWFKEGMQHISYSQVDSYSSCSLKWALKYILKLEEPWSPNLAFGNVFHEMWEWVGDRKNAGTLPLDFKEEIKKVKDEAWAKYYPEDEVKKFKDKKKITQQKEIMEQAISSFLGFVNGFDFEIVKIKDNEGKLIPAMEFGVGVPIENPLTKQYRTDFYIQLWPDMIIRRKDGRVYIIDHKTSAASYSQSKVDTAIQLALYAYGLSELLKQNEIPYENWVAYDVLTKTKEAKIQYIEKQVKQDDIFKMLMNVNMAIEGINKCSFCPSTMDMAHSFCGYTDDCVCGGSATLDYRKIYDIITAGTEEREQILAEMKEQNKAKKEEKKAAENVIRSESTNTDVPKEEPKPEPTGGTDNGNINPSINAPTDSISPLEW